jgi:hypothetical protein
VEKIRGQQSTRFAGTVGLVAFVWLILTGSATAQAGARLYPSPLQAQVQVGATVRLEVVVEDIEGLWAGDVRVQFDPALVQIEDADPNTPGVQVADGTLLTPDFKVKNEVDNVTGLAWYAVSQRNPAEPVNGSGTFTSITFRGVAPGTSLLNFAYQKLVDRDGVQIPVTVEAGQITVQPQGVSAGHTPAATSTATIAPPTATLQPSTQPSPITVGVARATETPVSVESPGQAPSATSPPAQVLATDTVVVPTSAATLSAQETPQPTASPPVAPTSTIQPQAVGTASGEPIRATGSATPIVQAMGPSQEGSATAGVTSPEETPLLATLPPPTATVATSPISPPVVDAVSPATVLGGALLLGVIAWLLWRRGS